VAANHRTVVVSWISLLSDLGGSFSMCLGVSIVSVLEVMFYICFRLRRNISRAKADAESVQEKANVRSNLQRFH
jgi:hypothetical protein